MTDYATWIAKRARDFRRRDIDAEMVLWDELRGRGLGYKFRYQHVIGRYVVDFACHEKRVVVEIDGPTHDAEDDARRDAVLRAAGWHVYRATNQDVYENLDGVLDELLELLDAIPSRSGQRREPHRPPATRPRLD